MNKFGNLDGRHRLALLGAVICWGLSVYFSYLGFKVGNTEMLWVGWIMAGVVTIVELAFNTPMHKLPPTLAIIGIVCYIYGVVTNITGFWSLQHPDVPFVWFQVQSIMPIIIGFVMEVLPEPLFMWGLDAKIGGDPIGNLVGFVSGSLKAQAPETGSGQPQQQKYKVPDSIKAAHSQSNPLGYNVTYPPVKGMETGSHRPPKPVQGNQAGRPNPDYHPLGKNSHHPISHPFPMDEEED